MRRNHPRTGTGISRFGKARCFASARGQPPSTGRPNRRQRNSRSAGPSLFRVPSGGIFFAPTRDVKAAASPRPPNFHGPIGKTAGQVYQTTISDSGISFAGITPESSGTVGNITDGSGCGTASIAEACRRVRAPIKLTEYGAHAIGSSKKVLGSFAGEPGSKTVLPRGKDVHSQYGLQQPSSHSSGFPRCGHRHAALCPGLLRPVCGSCSGGLRFCFRAGRRFPGGISGKPAARNAHFFRRRLSGHAFLAAVCIGYQRFCAAWAAACCKARICCA